MKELSKGTCFNKNISKLHFCNVGWFLNRDIQFISKVTSKDFYWIYMVYRSLKRNKDTRSLYEDTKIICGKGKRVIFTHSAILITADNNLTNCIPLIKVILCYFLCIGDNVGDNYCIGCPTEVINTRVELMLGL